MTSILPGEHGEERPLLALVHGVFAGAQMEVGGSLREPLAVGVNEACEERDRGDVIGGQHGDLNFRLSRGECTRQSATLA